MDPFDHAVVYAGERLAAAAAAWTRLGFTVTPIGHHTLGSSNHLIVFDRAYIELLGFAPGRPVTRPELAASPLGLSALVFKAQDADAVAARLAAAGVPATPVDRFSRPVDLGDGAPAAGWPSAEFRTVRLPAAYDPAGRLYWCEHRTPELVWRAGWQSHANGARELVGASVGARDVAAAGARWRPLVDPAAFVGRDDGFDVVAPPLRIAVRADATDRMTSLTIAVRDLAAFARHCAGAGISARVRGDAVVVDPSDAAGVELIAVERR